MYFRDVQNIPIYRLYLKFTTLPVIAAI